MERTFAWLGLSRRFSKDCERLPETAEAMIYGVWKQGRFPADKLVKTYTFDDINSAFADSESGAIVKPVIVF